MSWEIEYKKKLRTANEALRCVQSGMRVYIQPGCAEPETLVDALIQRAPFVQDVEIVHMMTMGKAPYVAPEMAGHFRHNAVFIGGNVREAVNEGRADYTPVYLSEIEDLFESGAMPLDVALIEVSPPDSHGFCSFGVGVDTTLTAARLARYVVAQVNDEMPRTYGDSFIHVNKIDAIVESSRPLCALKKPEVTEMQIAIARNVASLIEDGSVLQTGIGGIPDAVLPLLMDRKDLGVHSELVSDGVIPLIDAGVITGARKNFKPRKIILGFALGSKNLFDYVDNNPIFEFHPTAYTNDPSADRAQRQDGRDQLGAAGGYHRAGLLRLHRHVLLQRHRRTGGLPARGVALEGWQADHRALLDCERWNDLAHHADARAGSGRGDLTRADSLRRYRIRRCISARQIDPRACSGAD